MAKMKDFVQRLKQLQTKFNASFQNLPVKERGRLIREITDGQKTLQDFLQRTKVREMVNAGSKFSYENLKNSYQSLTTQWRRTEKLLEEFVGGAAAAASQGGKNTSQSPTQKALDSYQEILHSKGMNPSQDQLNNFQDQVNEAYLKAQDRYGSSDLDVKVEQVEGKVKVKIAPK